VPRIADNIDPAQGFPLSRGNFALYIFHFRPVVLMDHRVFLPHLQFRLIRPIQYPVVLPKARQPHPHVAWTLSILFPFQDRFTPRNYV
jgi:hypothetical protein